MKFFHKQKKFLQRNNKLSPALLFIIVGCLCAGIGIYFGLKSPPKAPASVTSSPPAFVEINTPEELPFDDVEEKAEETLVINSQESSDLTEIFKAQESQKQRPAGIYHKAPSWLKNAQKWNHPLKKNKISIIIDDIEFTSSHGWYWISQFNIPLTFAASFPTLKGRSLMKKAHQKGREVLLYLPLQPGDSKIKKPAHISLWLSPNLSKEKIDSMLDTKLKKAHKIIGFTNYFPSTFKKEDALETLLSHLSDREVVFLDAAATSSMAARIASIYNVPYLMRDITFYSKTPLNSTFQLLEKKLSKNHQLIIALKPQPAVLKGVLTWVHKMQKRRDVSFVPLSLLFKRLKNNAKPHIISRKQLTRYYSGFR